MYTEGITNLILTLLAIFIVPITGAIVINELTDGFHDYEMATWDMEKAVACDRLWVAMRRRGVHITPVHDGRQARFPLPPLNIVVTPGLSRTKVYVGPVTDFNERKIKALEAFVDGALG